MLNNIVMSSVWMPHQTASVKMVGVTYHPTSSKVLTKVGGFIVGSLCGEVAMMVGMLGLS